MGDQEEKEGPGGQREPARFPIGAIVNHRTYGRGRVAGHEPPFYVVHFKGETQRVPFVYQDMSLLTAPDDFETARLKAALREVLGDYGYVETELELGSRWIGGTVRIMPGREGTQGKEIPIEQFLKKIIGVREKLRVLEQKINNHPKLDSEEKLELEGYITRCYGSLTTFNSLFAHKTEQFRGEGGES